VVCALVQPNALTIGAGSMTAWSLAACRISGAAIMICRAAREIHNRVAGLPRFGAASLDMAFLAAGRLEGYWERNLQAWDMAAVAPFRRAAAFVRSDRLPPLWSILDTGCAKWLSDSLRPFRRSVPEPRVYGLGYIGSERPVYGRDRQRGEPL
jgi:hypothetical protein